MEFPLDALRTLAAVVDAGTLDAAAKRMHVTPSAVSQRLRTLEAGVGRVLLSRTKPVRATSDGEALLRLARQMTLLEHEASEELGLGSGAATVRLGVNADSLATWCIDALARVQRDHDVVFELHREDQERTSGLLASGTVMAAVTAQRDPVAGCTSTLLGTMDYLACARPSLVGDLAEARAVTFDAHDDLQQRYLALRGITTAPRSHYISSTTAYVEAVYAGLGWGMLLPSQYREHLASGALVALSGDIVRVPLYWQRWQLSSRLLDAVSAAVTQAAAASPDVTPAAG